MTPTHPLVRIIESLFLVSSDSSPRYLGGGGGGGGGRERERETIWLGP